MQVSIVTEHDVFIFTAALGLIIFVARIVGELCRKINQPILVGEVLAGVILGPSILGQIFPGFYHHLFPAQGVQPILLQGFSWLCVIFLLLLTGLEIDAGESIKYGKKNIFTTLFGFIFSFASVYFLFPYIKHAFSIPPDTDLLHFNLMFSTALAVVALPVISKILFDLKILRSDVGLNILTSHVMSDVFGWAILAVIVSLITKQEFSFVSAVKPLVVISLFFLVAMSLGRFLTDRLFKLFDIHGDETTSVISILFSTALISGAIAHLFGIHVIFGAFIAGIMVGESKFITQHTRKSTEDFIFGVFAPIFFVLIGMELNFTNGINWGVFLILFFVSSAIKILGGFLGAVLGGIGARNALVVGIGLNTQGTMGIIVGLLGLELGLFNQETFSMIVLISVMTSVTVGPLIKWAITLVQRPLAQYFDHDHVFLDVYAETKDDLIVTMAKLMKERKIIDDEEYVAENIRMRERTLSTAIGQGVALPHARIPNFKEPVLCFFRLKQPIEYDAPDKQPVQILFLELTDADDHGMQLNLISQVARLLSKEKNREKLITCQKEEEIHLLMSFDEKV